MFIVFSPVEGRQRQVAGERKREQPRRAARTSGPVGFAEIMELGMEGCPVPSPA
jgi:hypothetical protein